MTSVTTSPDAERQRRGIRRWVTILVVAALAVYAFTFLQAILAR